MKNESPRSGAAKPDREPPAELVEIRRLYFETTAATIQRDFERAIDLLKSLPDEEMRGRATVYMQGLAEMRKDWRTPKPGPGAKPAPRRRRPRR